MNDSIAPDPTSARAIKDELLAAVLPAGRYREVVLSVLRRLPDDWDYYRTVTLELSEEKPARGYASCSREEELEGERDEVLSLLDGHQEQCWVVTLYTPWLDTFSDGAVRWMVSHELGHVASGMACGSLVVGGVAYTKGSVDGDTYRAVTDNERDASEKIADCIARAWGFWLDEEAFEAEVNGLAS